MLGYHLIAMGKSKTKVKAKNTILGQVSWNYMGAAEYEFGAIPEALVRFLKCEESKVFSKLTIEFEGQQHSMRVWCRESQLEDLKTLFSSYSTARRDFKNPKHFDDLKDRVFFGIDKDKEFFVFEKKVFRSQLEDNLENTIKVLKDNEWWE